MDTSILPRGSTRLANMGAKSLIFHNRANRALIHNKVAYMGINTYIYIYKNTIYANVFVL